VTFPVPVDTFLGRLGSRAAIHSRPGRGELALLPLGTFTPARLGLALVVREGERRIRLPWGADAPVEQEIGLGMVRYGYRDPGGRFEIRFDLRSPFVPRDWDLSNLPCFYLRVVVRNLSGERLPVGIELELSGAPVEAEAFAGEGEAWVRLGWRWRQRLSHREVADKPEVGLPERYVLRLMDLPPPPEVTLRNEVSVVLAGEGAGWRAGSEGLARDLEVAPGADVAVEALLAVHTGGPALQVDGRPMPFRHGRRWADVEAVLADARAWKERALAATDRLAAELRETELPLEAYLLACHGLQSYLVNTWAVSDAAGRTRFSVWEGHPRFHATLDVEMNNAPFYLLFWPELLESLLLQWTVHAVDNAPPHDIGNGLIIEEQAYPIAMRVEEICNYALLHHLYWRYTGNLSVARRCRVFLTRLIIELLGADRDRDGYPDEGVLNTLDDAPDAIHGRGGGTYLGVKTYAAARALEELGRALGRDSVVRKAARLQERVRRTLRASWLGDRYPIHLPGAGWAGAAVLHADLSEQGRSLAGEVPYDGASIYAPLGLLPLLLSGGELPDVPERFLEDMRRQRRATLTRYGSAHTAGIENVWVSQNMVRDVVGLYLAPGEEWLQDLERYWRLQVDLAQRAGEDPRYAGYCDSATNPILTWYSRGLGVFGYWLGRRGVGVDLPARRILYSPDGGGGALPLWFLARDRRAGSGETPRLVPGPDGGTSAYRMEPAPAAELRLVPRRIGAASDDDEEESDG
jgi:hypothetical protein